MKITRGVLCLALACEALACTIQEAPTELSELNRFLYREWGVSDETLLTDGVANFVAVMAPVDIEGSLSERSFQPGLLSAEDVQEHERPDRPLENLLGVAVAYLSPWSTADHARIITIEDQTPAQPTAPLYQRTFTGAASPECFLSRECMTLTSVNEVRRENLVLSVDFTVFKDYRWVPLDDASEQNGRWSILARSWFTESFASDNGNSTLWQSHTLDLWMDRPDGSLLRYQSLWTETEISGVSDPDLILGAVRLSLDDTFEAEDDFIEELLEGS